MKYPTTEEMRIETLKAIKKIEKDPFLKQTVISNLLEYRSPAQTRFVTRKLYTAYVLLPRTLADKVSSGEEK